MIPLRDANPTQRTPVITIALIAVCVIVLCVVGIGALRITQTCFGIVVATQIHQDDSVILTENRPY